MTPTPASAGRRGWLAAAVLASAWPGAWLLTPGRSSASGRIPIALERQVPERFDGWAPDPRLRPLVPDPAVQSALARQYAQVLARTYRQADGRHVMLSIAYGDDQGGESTAVHRPSFCYRSQGFEVADRGVGVIEASPVAWPVHRLLARSGSRIEPITYWLMLDLLAVLPGLDRRLAQLRLGLAGWRADGMVIRLSSIGRDEAAAFALHERFATALHRALAPAIRDRYFGTGLAL